MDELKTMLIDIPNQHNLLEAFDKLAIHILRKVKLVTPNEQFYLRDIELFYYNETDHPDPYVHQDPRQLEFGEWYFHSFTDAKSFIASQWNGVDITFGNKSKKIYGGILIQKLQNIKTGELIDGVNATVKRIIQNLSNDELTNAALNNTNSGVFNETSPLHLETGINNYSLPIFKLPRKLAQKAETSRNRFYKAPCRYFNLDAIMIAPGE